MPLLVLLVFGVSFQALAQEPHASIEVSAKDDYITCWKQPCVLVAGSKWSEKNPNGVAIAVRMGVEPIATDNEVKGILTNDFKYYGVTNIRFFFEQNDAIATGIAFHIRGGTDGLYRVTEMREQVSKLAKRAKNDNPLFIQ